MSRERLFNPSVMIVSISTWVALWVYLIIAALAVASFVLGYIARRDLIDLGVYKQSNFYQGAAVISLGCSPFTLLMLAGLLYLPLASLR